MPPSGPFRAIVRRRMALRRAARSSSKVSLAGDNSAANIVWMGRQDLNQRVEAAVVGVLADSKRTGAQKGRNAGGEGEAVLSAVGKEGGVEELCAVQMVNGREVERVAAVEAAVMEFGLMWLPWRSGRVAAPRYRDAVPLRLYSAHDEEQEATGLDADEAVIKCGVLAQLGLLCGLRSGRLSVLQIGELCSAAVALLGGTVEEAATLLGHMGEQADQAVLLEAVLVCAGELASVRSSLLREAAETTVATVGFLGPPEDDLLPITPGRDCISTQGPLEHGALAS